MTYAVCVLPYATLPSPGKYEQHIRATKQGVKNVRLECLCRKKTVKLYLITSNALP